jgi:hypothetical protein
VQALIAAVAAVAVLAVAGAGSARASGVDGISDQNLSLWSGNFVDDANVFDAPLYDYFPLAWVGPQGGQHIQYARFVTAPDAVAQGGTCLQNLVDWLSDATAAHLTPVIAVWNVAEGGCADDGHPSTAAYTSEITQLLGHLEALGDGDVPYIEAWNEPNDSGVTAAQAAAYWLAANTVCASDGCTAIAGDFVDDDPDQGSQGFNPGCAAGLTYDDFLAPYEDDYVTALGTARPAIWGFHPYYAVNCEQSASVTTFEAHLPTPAGQVWFTEVGAWECRLGESTPRGPTVQEQDAGYLVNTLIPQTAPAHVFYYELAPLVYTQDCKKYADSALYEAPTAPGVLQARPAAAVIFGPDGSLASTTGSSLRVTPTDATVTGTVVPGGIYDAQYWFDYGPTAAYGSQTAAVALGPGLDSQDVQASIDGLAPGGAYHYRLVVADSTGVTRMGDDEVLPAVSLSAGPASVGAGGSLGISWSGEVDPAAGDWIGLYQPGAPADAYLDWFYADSCSQTDGAGAEQSGSCSYTMPAAGGTYELRLYGAGGSAPLATSGPVTDTAPTVTLSASPAGAAVGAPITVSWSGVSAPTSQDRIDLYSTQAPPPETPVASFFTSSCSASPGGIAPATGSCAYTLPAPGGYELRLVSGAGAEPLAVSAPIAATIPVPADSAAPVISGAGAPLEGQLGDTLACSTGVWSNSPTAFAFAWQRDGAPIAGANGQTYVVGPADLGQTLACSVTASNAGGAGPPATSPGLAVAAAALAGPIAGPPPAAAMLPGSAGEPAISGAAIVGDVLTEMHTSWSGAPTAFGYQWERCDTDGGDCRAIAGATASTYTLTVADTGSTVRVEETASNAAGTAAAASSAPTAVVAALPAPAALVVSATVRPARRSATFHFHAGAAATGFRCALVRHGARGAPRYAPCAATTTFRNLRPGSYVLDVVAVDPGGGRRATYRFRIY